MIVSTIFFSAIIPIRFEEPGYQPNRNKETRYRSGKEGRNNVMPFSHCISKLSESAVNAHYKQKYLIEYQILLYLFDNREKD